MLFTAIDDDIAKRFEWKCCSCCQCGPYRITLTILAGGTAKTKQFQRKWDVPLVKWETELQLKYTNENIYQTGTELRQYVLISPCVFRTQMPFLHSYRVDHGLNFSLSTPLPLFLVSVCIVQCSKNTLVHIVSYRIVSQWRKHKYQTKNGRMWNIKDEQKRYKE